MNGSYSFEGTTKQLLTYSRNNCSRGDWACGDDGGSGRAAAAVVLVVLGYEDGSGVGGVLVMW
jgi:hypothetical protein